MYTNKLTDEVKQAIAQIRPSLVATSNKSGKPNVSPKGSFQLLEGELVFADMNSPRTVANLKENPQIAVIGLDPATRKGYRIWGRAEVLASGPLYDKLCAKTARGTPKHCVRITVDDALVF